MSYNENVIAVARFIKHWNLDSKKWPGDAKPLMERTSSKRFDWLGWEEEYLVANYNHMMGQDIADHLGRTLQSVRKKAFEMHLTKKIKTDKLSA